MSDLEKALDKLRQQYKDILPAYRANTPEQKRDVLNQIYEAWLKFPDLRLGQLIIACCNNDGKLLIDIYLDQIEDYDLSTKIQKFVNDWRMQNILK